MITAWVVYGLLVGSFIVVAAHAVSRVCRIFGQPTRWVWLGALMLLMVLLGVAPYRQAPVVSFGSDGVFSHALPDVMRSSDVRTWPNPMEVLESLRRLATVKADELMTLASQTIPDTWGYSFVVVWGSLSLCLFLLFAMVSWPVYRARKSWPVTELHGVPVLLTSTFGPMVIGVLRPTIVIPRWLLECREEEQRIVLAHEREHVRAYDSLVLAIACVGVVLVPWHPAVWWIFSRLRLAVELDCDRRVLRQGVAPRAYGAVLIELAGHCSRLPVGAPALADRTSHLEQRILAMRPSFFSYPKLYSIALSSIAGVALIAACTTPQTKRSVNPMTPTNILDLGADTTFATPAIGNTIIIQGPTDTAMAVPASTKRGDTKVIIDSAVGVSKGRVDSTVPAKRPMSGTPVKKPTK